MYLQWQNNEVTLEMPEDFQRFKIVVLTDAVSVERAQMAFNGLAHFVSEGTAWVAPQSLIGLAGKDGDAEWCRSLMSMIAAAGLRGWIDEANGAIKVHVEWPEAARV